MDNHSDRQGNKVTPNYYYLVEYSRTGKGDWHTELRTLEESAALACYDENVREFGNFVWRVVLTREIVRSKSRGLQDHKAR